MVVDTKIVEGIRRRAKQGKLVGRVPYGYVIRAGVLEIIPEEADIVQQIFRLYYEQRMGFSDIAHFLNEQNLLRRGKLWRRDSIKRTIENIVYYGKVKVKNEEFFGDFPRIIEDEYVDAGKSIEVRLTESLERRLEEEKTNNNQMLKKLPRTRRKLKEIQKMRRTVS